MAGIALRVVPIALALGLGSCAIPQWSSDSEDVEVIRTVFGRDCERADGKFIVVSEAPLYPDITFFQLTGPRVPRWARYSRRDPS
jgi:hypothetical protein